MRTDAVCILDLHDQTVYQARVAIEAALRRANGLYRIRVVHGHRRGTAIRDMIDREMPHKPQVLRLERVNEGTTDLVLRPLVTRLSLSTLF